MAPTKADPHPAATGGSLIQDRAGMLALAGLVFIIASNFVAVRFSN